MVAALVINWAMICITHLKFRPRHAAGGEGNGFPEFRLSPDKLAVSAVSRRDPRGDVSDPGHPQLSVCLIPVWLLILAAGYLLRRSAPAPVAALEER